MAKVFNILSRVLALSLILAVSSCCEKPGPDIDPSKSRKVLLLYSAGHNSLKNYLREDIQELKSGWLPGGGDNDDMLLVYTHTPRGAGYNNPSTPYLIRLYQGGDGKVVSDTLMTYPEGTISSSALQMNNVLAHIKKSYPAVSYGMIFSSHATGYLPAGYYSDPSSYRFNEPRLMSMDLFHTPAPVPYEEPEHNPAFPMVKSIGQDQTGKAGCYLSYEMELEDFAAAIPMELDYILFDACLMGGIEVAYALKDKCRNIGFSQAEVLAQGLDYKTLAEHLLKKEKPEPQAVCEDFFMQYDNKTGVEKSATISLVNTGEIDNLAAVCATLFGKYNDRINQLDKSGIQGFGGSKNYFFDLADIIRNAGATDAEMTELQKATDKVVLYKAHTKQYYSATDYQIHPIEAAKFSGLSMYLPHSGTAELHKFYRTLSWNEATGLVE